MKLLNYDICSSYVICICFIDFEFFIDRTCVNSNVQNIKLYIAKLKEKELWNGVIIILQNWKRCEMFSVIFSIEVGYVG